MISQSRTIVLTDEYIRANTSTKGGYTRLQLKEWGVKWPPKRGGEGTDNREHCEFTETDNLVAQDHSQCQKSGMTRRP